MNNRFIFRSALLLTFVVMAMGPSTIHAQKWTSMSPEGCECKFKLPGTVNEEVNEDELVTTYKYSTEYNGTAYLFSYTVHTAPLSNYEDLAATSLESFNETLEGNIVKQEAWSVKKHVGKKATIQLPALNAACQYRVVLAGQVQYQAVVLAPVGEFDSKTAEKFFKAVKVKQ